MSSLGQGFQGQLGQGVRKSYYSAVDAESGQAVAVFFRKPDGSIIEAFWRRRQNDWGFWEVLPKSATPPPNISIAATLWANSHYRIYYFDENMFLCELAFESKTAPSSKQLDKKIRARENSGISAVCFRRDGKSNLRVYFIDPDGKLQETTIYDKGTPIDVSDLHPNTALQFVTLTGWDNEANEIRGYYQDTEFNIREIAYKERAWGKSTIVQPAKALVPFAVAVSGADGKSPKVCLYTVSEKTEIMEMTKEGCDLDAKWGNSTPLAPTTGAKSLSAIGNQFVEEEADMHILSSDDSGDNFVHNWKTNGALADKTEIINLDQPEAKVITYTGASIATVPIKPLQT
ncbi:hypothetical protein Dda_5325 [Drechslerella dactyloides]|uniref:Fucose-specific lectin n=1 Tax=Drechslerella dactyloides TaxID=74499 RepID=A0AAD6NIR7_DREDA|nr:hypothetical protein Dda_5325 [Drechslerella dactyloides]